jgi:CxxC motif-containing protein (DUF1111 family)
MSMRPIGLGACAVLAVVLIVKAREGLGQLTQRAANVAVAEPPRAAPAVEADGPGAFSLSIPGLSREDRRAFSVGNALFRDNWVPAPSSAEGRDGLGPLFVASSCSACHMEDGRGRPPLDDAERSTGMVVFSSSSLDPSAPHPMLGAQVQELAMPGVEPEAHVRLVPVDVSPHGAAPLMTWRVELRTPAGAPIHDAVPSVRMGPQLIGLGLLEAVDDETIRAAADPEDRDRDGISGRAHEVDADGVRRIGRFGWKATQATLDAQVAAALHGDMGLTTSVHPRESLTEAQRASITAPSGGDPEVDDLKVQRLAHYCRVLAVPRRRNADDPRVQRGSALFESTGCVSCHRPSMRTGTGSPVSQYHEVDVAAYTDLLLHDMGEGLADGRPDGMASGSEWRTPPLWGLGLIEVVNGHTRLLHDGRARSVEEAILWHGGEAASSRRSFEALGADDREALLAFLRSI